MPRMTPSRRRKLALACLLVGLGSAPQSLALAQADEIPPDDGAPPSDYEPVPGAEIIDLWTTSANDTLAVEEAVATAPQTPPVDNAFPIAGSSRGSCASNFGVPRSEGRTHMGVDCFAPLGTPLVAVETGTIRYAMPGEPFSCATGGDISGNRVSVRGRSGYVYYYGHLDTIAVATEQRVEKGQIIGTVGRTGNASCSTPHLHFEVKCGENNDPFDPYPVMTSWGRTTLSQPVWPSTQAQGVAVSPAATSRQDLFALECGERILQKTWRSGGDIPSGWTLLDGATRSDPDLASPGSGVEPQVVVRGTDDALYQRSGANWHSLGGVCTSGPTASYSDPTRLDVFCRGTDQGIWQRFWTSSTGWSGWFKLGGIATSDPDATSPGPGRPAQVFVRGTDNGVWQMLWTGSSWATYPLGGTCTSGPSAAYSGPNRLDVFCRGTDMAIWHRHWLNGIGWSPGWLRIDGQPLSDPEAASSGPGGVAQVFVRGIDRRLYQFSWNGSTWAAQQWGVT